MEEVVYSTNSDITIGPLVVPEIDSAHHSNIDLGIHNSSSSTENEESSSKIVLEEDNNKSPLVSDADDSDNELFNVSKRRTAKKSTVLSDDDDSSSESNALPNKIRTTSNNVQDDTDEESDQERSSSSKRRIRRPAESDSDSNDSVASDGPEVLKITEAKPAKPYQYSRAIFDPDDASDEDEGNSHALTGGRWQSEEQEEEDRILNIAKTVLTEKSGKPPKAKKVAESVVRAERAKEVSLIHSESQRRVREGPISLPYHRPKQHTLADFLNRSKQRSRPVTTGKNNLKQSMRNMEVLRQLEATKKEVVEFYKSESEDEDTEDQEWTPAQAPPANSDSEEEEDTKEKEGVIEGALNSTANAEEAMEHSPTEALEETEGSVPLEVSDSTTSKDSGLEENETLVEPESFNEGKSTECVAETERGDEDCGVKGGEVLQQSDDQLLAVDTEMGEGKTGLNSKLASESLQDDNTMNTDGKNSVLSLEEEQEEESPMELGDDSSAVTPNVEDCSDDTSDAPQKRVESLEDDEDYLPNLNDDTSIARNSESLKRMDKLKLNTQDMEDEEMAELVLMDDEDLSEQQESAVGPTVSAAAEADAVKVSMSLLPPQLSRLAAKLGGAVPLNTVSPALRLPLTADRDGFIDLDDDFASPKLRDPGLTDLMNRFAKHSATKKQQKKAETITMSIVSKEKDAQGREQLVTSDVAVSVEGDPQETEMSRCQTPGRKLQLLKSNLRQQITQRRAQATKERQMNKNFLETETVEQDIDDPFALPDDEEEVELTESEEGESEPEEEDDVVLVDKPRSKNNFLEDEAEEERVNEDVASEEDNHVNDTSEDESDDEIIARKPSKKHRPKKGALVLDSDDDEDDEALPSVTETKDTDQAYSNVRDLPVADDPLTESSKGTKDAEFMDNIGSVDNKENNVNESLGWSHMMESTTNQDHDSELDHNDDDLPATQPIESDQMYTPPAQCRRGSVPCNTSLDDSSSLDLLGSCIPGHQPVSSRNTMPSPLSTDACDGFTRSRGSTASLGLPMESQELLWCAVDNSSSKASCPFPATGAVGLDSCSAVEGFTNSQELRLDFRGVASPSQEADLQLPELLSGRFTGTGPALPTDDKCDATQGDMSNLMDLCSGQFTGMAGPSSVPGFSSQPLSLTGRPSTNKNTMFDDTVLLTNSRLPTQTRCPDVPSLVQRDETLEDDLLDLCSGDFEIQPKGGEASRCSKGQAKLTSFFTRGKSAPKSQPAPIAETAAVSTAAVVPSTPPRTSTKTTAAVEEDSEDGSDTEEEEEEEEEKKDEQTGDAKTRKRIIMMDDDDDDDDEEINDDTAAVHAEVEEGDDEEEEEEDDEEEEGPPTPKFIIYDDDENEVTEEKFGGFKDRKRGGIRSDFLEKEAELSGSEVESDEEDGADYDVMDEEEGDKEHYDVEKLRDEIGQTHHRGQLAQDQREVRLLQELYLEDGDLHGDGRQRSFRWKNLNNEEEADDRRASDGEAEGEEEDDEEANKWRQQRFEREQFLKDNEGKADDTHAKESNSNAPDLLKTTSFPVITKSVRVSRNNSSKNQTPEVPAPVKKPLQQANPEQDAPTVMHVVRQTSLPGNLTKCGSFLSRGASKLARLASLLKDNGGPSRGSNAKAGSKFLFQSVSADDSRQSQDGEEQQSDGPVPATTQQKRRMPQPSPMPVKKKPRLEPATRASGLNTSIFKHL